MPIRECNRVYDEVIMYVVMVQMRRDHDLKMIAPHFLCELHADLVRDLWCNLAGHKTLDAVVSADAVIFSERFLRCDHFRTRCVRTAIHACDKSFHTVIFAVVITCIFNNVVHGLIL